MCWIENWFGSSIRRRGGCHESRVGTWSSSYRIRVEQANMFVPNLNCTWQILRSNYCFEVALESILSWRPKEVIFSSFGAFWSWMLLVLAIPARTCWDGFDRPIWGTSGTHSTVKIGEVPVSPSASMGRLHLLSIRCPGATFSWSGISRLRTDLVDVAESPPKPSWAPGPPRACPCSWSAFSAADSKTGMDRSPPPWSCSDSSRLSTSRRSSGSPARSGQLLEPLEVLVTPTPSADGWAKPVLNPAHMYIALLAPTRSTGDRKTLIPPTLLLLQ